jgi:TldD protein
MTAPSLPAIRQILEDSLQYANEGELLELRYHHKAFRTLTARDGRLERSLSRTRSGVGVRVLAGGTWGFACTSEASPAAVARAITAARAHALGSAALRRDPPRAAAPHPLGGRRLRGRRRRRAAQPRRAHRAGAPARRPRPRRPRQDLQRLDHVHRAAQREGHRDQRRRRLHRAPRAAPSCRSRRWPKITANAWPKPRASARRAVGPAFLCATLPSSPRRRPGARSSCSTRRCRPAAAPRSSSAPIWSACSCTRAIGHTVEADFVQSGTVATGKLGERVASPLVTLRDSGASVHAAGAGGTEPVDDEGVPSTTATIIEDGVLTGYLHNRESAARFGVAPTGNARAWEFSDAPLIRMRNTYIEPGESELGAMIEGTPEGLAARGGPQRPGRLHRRVHLRGGPGAADPGRQARPAHARRHGHRPRL